MNERTFRSVRLIDEARLFRPCSKAFLFSFFFGLSRSLFRGLSSAYERGKNKSNTFFMGIYYARAPERGRMGGGGGGMHVYVWHKV